MGDVTERKPRNVHNFTEFECQNGRLLLTQP